MCVDGLAHVDELCLCKWALRMLMGLRVLMSLRVANGLACVNRLGLMVFYVCERVFACDNKLCMC